MDEARVPRPSAETGQPAPGQRRVELADREAFPRLRHLAAIESSRGSFDGAVQAIERATGQQLGKRQVEDLAARAAVDFDTLYAHRDPQPARRVICWCCPVTARVS